MRLFPHEGRQSAKEPPGRKPSPISVPAEPCSPVSGGTSPAASSLSEEPVILGDREPLLFLPKVHPRDEHVEAVLLAVADDDVDLIRGLVHAGRLDRSALERCLVCAADKNAWRVLDFLLNEAGQEVNTQDELGTCLHHALAADAAEAVQVLVDAGACPSMLNDAGELPLAFCHPGAEGADAHHRPSVRELIESYEKRYALCKLRYMAWGLSEVRNGSANARFRGRVEAGAALPRLTVKRGEEQQGGEEVIGSLKQMVVGVTEGDFDAVLSLMDVSLPKDRQGRLLAPAGGVGSQPAGEGTVEEQREQQEAPSSMAAAAAPMLPAAAAPPTATAQGAVEEEQQPPSSQQQQPEDMADALASDMLLLQEQERADEEGRGAAGGLEEEEDGQAGCLGDVQKGCFCALVEKVWELFTLLCTV